MTIYKNLGDTVNYAETLAFYAFVQSEMGDKSSARRSIDEALTVIKSSPKSPDFEGARFWTQFLVMLDVLFITVGLWSFEPVVSGD